MSDDDSVTEAPLDDASDEAQHSAFQSLLSALPYECDSVQVMQLELQKIMAKICICAKAKNWRVLTSWNRILQSWLLLRCPIARPTRASLVLLYYELCLLPGVEPGVIWNWADTLNRVLSNKPGGMRKLEITDLQLPWKPLWRSVQKELSAKEQIYDSTSRSVINIFLYIAWKCRRYFPVTVVPEMLETFLPLLTKTSVTSIIPVTISFLPPTNSHLYIPILFKIWEAFNSNVLDDRMLELSGELSEEHVAGGAVPGDGSAEWKDVGIWSERQWTFLMSKGIAAMCTPQYSGIPVGSMSRPEISTGTNDLKPTNIRKEVDKTSAIAKILVYSINAHSEEQGSETFISRGKENNFSQPEDLVAGSKALDSLNRIITNSETYFHPSNSGDWTPHLSTFLQCLTTEFTKRIKEEELRICKTPQDRRLTPSIRRTFVTILLQPALLVLFSKNPRASNKAQVALGALAMLEPDLVMPELLERTYDGLEIVNETHRTIAVLSVLSRIARPIVTESIWPGGQKHLMPLLELCIPGIDLNDPTKTNCTAKFVESAVLHMKLGDLSTSQESHDNIVKGVDRAHSRTSRKDEEEKSFVLTTGFADWVTSLIRRVLVLYENLPEGGRKIMTGDKQEESVLKSIKSMMGVMCLHLSDPLFDLALNTVYDYATTNAKSHSVRAFGQLVACLARANPEKTIAKFLPFCATQIEEELRQGASSVRTTSAHQALSSDTTLLWNMAILRGCLEYGGTAILKHKQEIMKLVSILITETKSESGYSSTGQLITSFLSSVGGVYPINPRFVNTNEWDDPAFDRTHNVHWGRLHELQDVKVEWHIPSSEEIDFVLETLDQVAKPALEQVELLLKSTASWDSIARNDFCRYLYTCGAVWSALPCFFKEPPKEVVNPYMIDALEVSGLLVTQLDVKAGFALSDPADPKYQAVVTHRLRFGEVIGKAASALRTNTGREDHIDAILRVVKALGEYLLVYALRHNDFHMMQKNYIKARNLNRTWVRQKDNSRSVCVKRAHLYHSGRVHVHSMYRRRSELDDKLIMELLELSLSTYTEVRKQAQTILRHVYGSFFRSSRLILPALFNALTRGNNPDRMKGALYILGNRGMAAFALSDQTSICRYFTSLLDCQHEEKTSVQNLVDTVAHDCLPCISEETVHTDAYTLDTPDVDRAVEGLSVKFSVPLSVRDLREAMDKAHVRVAKWGMLHTEVISSILEIATRPTTHWRYVQIAASFLSRLLRRDVPTTPALAEFLLGLSTNVQSSIRATAQKAIVTILTHVKIRSYSKSHDKLWRDERNSPFEIQIPIEDPREFLERLEQPIANGYYIDKVDTGFILWTPTIKGYKPVSLNTPTITWESQSWSCLKTIRKIITAPGYFRHISILWSHESNEEDPDFRKEHTEYIKHLAKIFQDVFLVNILEVIDPLLFDEDKFMQRTGVEMLFGLLRGSKDWSKSASDALWAWTGARLNRLLFQINPETMPFWESILQYQLAARDRRRNSVLIDWIESFSLDLKGDSTFEMNKRLSSFKTILQNVNVQSQANIKFVLDSVNADFAETREVICHCIYYVARNRWLPSYPSSQAFHLACKDSSDPLQVCAAKFMNEFDSAVARLLKLRENRLPPRVSQSEYDKIGLTLLGWLRISASSTYAYLALPYAIKMLPEILRMLELEDNPSLQSCSVDVLYAFSALVLSTEYVEVILDAIVSAIKSSTSWKIRLHALPMLLAFLSSNIQSIAQTEVVRIVDILIDCLEDENVEVRELVSKVLSRTIRFLPQSVITLKNRFIMLMQKTSLPPRRDPSFSEKLRSVHAAILGICALLASFPYSVEEWMPSLIEELAVHAADPTPISTTIRKCALEFKKTHQDTWHKDQYLFNEDQQQSLSTILVGTSYYA